MKKRGKKEITFPCILKNNSFHFVETFNLLRTNICYAAADKQYRKIVITSSISGEGKSTVAINLAIAFANTNCRVLLIDCDLRRPALHRYLQIDGNAPGLSTALVGRAEIEQCICPMQELGIDVVPAGPIPPNPAELVGSAKMAKLIERLSKQYEYILFDTPPASVVTDAAVLSKIADGVLFVIRHHYTKIQMAQHAKSNLELVGATVIGTVLNKFSAKKSGMSYAAYDSKQYKSGYQ